MHSYIKHIIDIVIYFYYILVNIHQRRIIMKSGLKKTIAFVLTLCAVTTGTIAPSAGKFILSPNPIVAQAATQIGDYIFEQRSTNMASLMAYVGNATSLTLPAQVTIKGKVCTVTDVNQNAFENNKTLKSVTFPNKGYSNIGDMAFSNCSNLSSITLPANLAFIGNYAFSGTAISSITIPSKVKRIGSAAFRSCTNLTTVNYNTSLLTEFKSETFSCCPKLKSITIPSTITSLGSNFASECTSLTSIKIPDSVSFIGYGAFQNCTKLSSVTLPSTPTEIEAKAFTGTPWLSKQTRTNGMIIKNGSILDVTGIKGTLNIPSGVRYIPQDTFSGNTAITKVNMASSVEKLSPSAFQNCTNLATVQLSNYISEIPSDCFSGCTKLSSITLTSRITAIRSRAFQNCSSLRSINFPQYLKTIEDYAFASCSSLTSLTNVKSNNAYTVGRFAFNNSMNLKNINGSAAVVRSGYRVVPHDFLEEYLGKDDENGFIQMFIDMKSTAVVDEIKNKYPNYNKLQIAHELEKWMCANGISARQDWKNQTGNTNYPDDLEKRPEYHRESSILLNGKGVCEGWAKGYNILLQKAGISAEIVESQTHAWNVVYMDGKWFNIDAYWDDNGTASKDRWFMVSDAEAYNLESSNQKGVHKQGYIVKKSTNYKVEYWTINCNTPMGDVNVDGKLDSTDISWLTYYVNNKKDPDKWFNHTCADLNFDGNIDYSDLQLLKKKI